MFGYRQVLPDYFSESARQDACSGSMAANPLLAAVLLAAGDGIADALQQSSDGTAAL